MKNKRLSFIMSFAVLLASCSSSSKDALIFVYDESDTFISSFDTALQIELTKRGCSFQTYYAGNSQIKQNESLVEAVDKMNPKMMFINPVDRLSSGAIIDKVSTKDIPVVFFNRQPLDQDMIRGRKNNNKIFYVGTDPNFEGKAQAKMVENLFGTSSSLNPLYDKNGDGIIQTVLIKGEIGHQDSEKRSKAAMEALKNDGYQIETLYSTYCNWSRSLAKDNSKEIMKKYGKDIELILCNNDDMALGVIDYLLSNENAFEWEGESLPFPIFGVDGTTVGLEYVRKGLLSGTVKNESHRQAVACVRIVEEIQKYGKITESFAYHMANEYTIYVEGSAITTENLV